MWEIYIWYIHTLCIFLAPQSRPNDRTDFDETWNSSWNDIYGTFYPGRFLGADFNDLCT